MKNSTNYILLTILVLGLLVIIFYSNTMDNKNDKNNDSRLIIDDEMTNENADNSAKSEDMDQEDEMRMEADESTEMVDEISSSEDVIDETKPEMGTRTQMTTQQKISLKRPEMQIDSTKTYVATMKTSQGDIVIELNQKDAPVTVNNFVYLANLGFYDDLTFHRVIDGFMIQGGDPLGNGTGGPGYKFEDEISSNNSNVRGSIAMANSGPATNGSQFFINQVDNLYLDTKHTVFGNVISGMDVVDKIAKTENQTPVDIESVMVEVK